MDDEMSINEKRVEDFVARMFTNNTNCKQNNSSIVSI